MSPLVKKLMYGFMGFLAAMASALAASDGGTTMTISQVGSIPLLSWILALGAFFAGVMGKHDEAKSK